MPKITPFLWFETQAEEAARYYCSLFKNSKIKKIIRYGEAGPGKKGEVMTVEFSLDGQEYTALNGGSQFKFNESVSFVIHCKKQKDVDALWKKLTRDGEASQCGWLKDKYGLSWQIVPNGFVKLLDPSKHPKRAAAAMEAMMKMDKLDLKALKKAHAAA